MLKQTLQSNHNVSILPHKVSESSGQVHRGWAAAQHGQDALEVEELQELVPAGGQINTSLSTHIVIQRLKDLYTWLFNTDTISNKIMTLTNRMNQLCSYLSTESSFSQKTVRTVTTSSHSAWLVGETSAKKRKFAFRTSGFRTSHDWMMDSWGEFSLLCNCNGL